MQGGVLNFLVKFVDELTFLSLLENSTESAVSCLLFTFYSMYSSLSLI